MEKLIAAVLGEMNERGMYIEETTIEALETVYRGPAAFTRLLVKSGDYVELKLLVPVAGTDEEKAGMIAGALERLADLGTLI